MAQPLQAARYDYRFREFPCAECAEYSARHIHRGHAVVATAVSDGEPE